MQHSHLKQWWVPFFPIKMASSGREKNMGWDFMVSSMSFLYMVFSTWHTYLCIIILKNHFHQDKNLWLHLMEKSWMNGGAKHSRQTDTRKIPDYIKMEKQKNDKWVDGQTWFLHLFSLLVLPAQDPHPHKLNRKCMWDSCYSHGCRALHLNTMEADTSAQFLH